MKYKKLLRNLELAKAWYDRQPASYQKACKRPGGIGQRVIVGTVK